MAWSRLPHLRENGVDAIAVSTASLLDRNLVSAVAEWKDWRLTDGTCVQIIHFPEEGVEWWRIVEVLERTRNWKADHSFSRRLVWRDGHRHEGEGSDLRFAV